MILKEYTRHDFYEPDEIIERYLSKAAIKLVRDRDLSGVFYDFDEVKDVAMDSLSKYKIEGFLNLIPPIGPILIEDLATNTMLYSGISCAYKPDSFEKRFSDKGFAQAAFKVISSMTDKSVWYEKFYYRFVLLNEFLVQENETITIGDYLKNNEQKIDELFINGTSKKEYYTDLLVKGYSSASLLGNLRHSKDDSLFNSVTKPEALTILKNNETFFLTGRNLGREDMQELFEMEFKSVLGFIRSGETSGTYGIAEELLKESFSNAVKTFGYSKEEWSSVESQLFVQLLYTLRDSAGKFNTMLFAKEISKMNGKLTPEEVYCAVLAASEGAVVCNSKSPSKIDMFNIFYRALTTFKNPANFVSFITLMVLEYDGPVMDADAFRESVFSGEENYNLSPDILVDLIGASNVVSPRTKEVRSITRRLMANRSIADPSK